jgi:putative OPT family oligopeptide transporter
MPPKELTPRGLLLGAVITIVFTAANVYLGLKVGLTFASSIPAAVISMAVLKLAGGATILENNAVQTQASAAGTLSSIIFVIPALVMVGHWRGFPYLETAGLCAGGGILGVMFTIPLRRALVVESALPFPEGVAAAEILRLGGDDASGGARALATGGIVSAVLSLATSGFALLADNVTTTLAAGHALFRLSSGFSLALVGAGYLMGAAAGAAILLGFAASWLVTVPILTAITPRPPGLTDTAFALGLWAHQVRFIGAGTIAVAAIWTLATLAPSIARGVSNTFAGFRRATSGAAADRTERDLGGRTILTFVAVAIFVLFAAFTRFLPAGAVGLAVFGTLFAVLFGFIVAAACGYMAGIVGSSASPISGIAIVAITLASLALLAMPAGATAFAIPLALFITSAVIAVATISNDNLQDLKTGRLVGATPASQQVALLVGVLVGAAIIPPILELLYRAYGFTGALPRSGMNPVQALAAPQATLMAAIASGILGHTIDWTMISIGIVFGIVLIGVDLALRRRTRALRLPVLATGIGLYLPPTIGSTLVIGAGLAWLAKRMTLRDRAAAGEQQGVLIASGFIVGESLVGVLVAAVIGATGRQNALSLVGPGFKPVATVLGLVCFMAACSWFVRAIGQAAMPTSLPSDPDKGSHP